MGMKRQHIKNNIFNYAYGDDDFYRPLEYQLGALKDVIKKKLPNSNIGKLTKEQYCKILRINCEN